MIVTLVLLLSLSTAVEVAAQGGDGGLRGTIQDSQGGALPGVTVTARSPEVISPSVAVSDATGLYRLVNLPPGTYTLTAELSGFAAFRREGILLRAGATFQVDITMEVGTLAETITVTAESPMIEVARPSNVLNIDAKFQKEVPVVESHFWSDFLQYTPGVLSRPHNDGSGRQNYFGNANEHRENVVMMDGMFAGNYNDYNINRTGLSTEAIEDTQVKTGGVDASAPMGMSLVINMVSKSGGDQFQGSVGGDLQPLSWNDNNAPTGSPSIHAVHQSDYSLGGPIKREQAWFFAALRKSEIVAGVGRAPALLALHKAFNPDKTLGNSRISSLMPFVKVTTKLGNNHTLAGIFQSDRLDQDIWSEISFDQVDVLSTGGQMYGAKLTSTWGQHATSTFTFDYNNKGGDSAASYEGKIKTGPQIFIHQTSSPNQGILQGSGTLVQGGNFQSMVLDDSSLLMLRGDVTYFKEGLAGSHEFQAGFLALPRNQYDTFNNYLDNGFILEERQQIDLNNPAAGTVPFHRRYVTGDLSLQTAGGRDRDVGLYVADSWKPTTRLTASLGLRTDFVHRFDTVRNQPRGSSVEVAPRLGFSYLLTKDAKNVLRASYGRYHRQLMGGRDPLAAFGGSNTAAFLDTYDVNRNGSFSAERATPATTARISALQFDQNFHQPITDELDYGYRHQFPWSLTVDVAGIRKVIQQNYALVEINGFYPAGPNQPFGGFGKVDPNFGIIYRATNNSWSTTTYNAFQAVITKNMSHNFQVVSTIHRQWQHLNGTWDPTDPARFIQPDAFANNRNIWRTDGLNDQDSLSTGTALTNNPMWAPYSLRFAGTYSAPFGMTLSSSFTVVGGPWNGPVLQQLAANDPQIRVFGPSTVTSSTGFAASNPLATRIRFLYPTRGEGQAELPPVRILGLKVGKTFKLGSSREFQASLSSFNLLNEGRYSEFSRNGPNRSYSPSTYQTATTLQEARAYQISGNFRF